jgi:MinD superfamily P-loop ATPase
MSRPLRVAVASGKGGTGKTTVATSLAVALAEAGLPVAYLDCDVEEPNGHLFLRPELAPPHPVTIPVPAVDAARCTRCGDCGRACRHSAILVLPQKVLTFPQLCHGCGGCTLACGEGAIREVPRPIGVVEAGSAGGVAFRHGRLDVGEAMAPPVIRAVLAAPPPDRALVIDAPPGTSCPVIEAVKAADVVLLVTEPTPFGLHDLRLAVAMLRELGLPCAVAVNRAGTGDREVYDYCAAAGLPVLLEVPDDRAIAHAYSRGELAVRARPHLAPALVDLHARLAALAGAGGRPAGARPQPPPRPAPTGGPGPADFPSAAIDAAANGVHELVVVSGKGGTGKTSVVASFAALAEEAAVADCDVDAADLHLVLDPTVLRRWPFSGGKVAVVDPLRCTGCAACAERCRFDAIRAPEGGAAVPVVVDPVSCEGCGVCVDTCPAGALALADAASGEWFVSGTRCGPLAHARLGTAQANSGKLVSLVRREGQALCHLDARQVLICDGSPGIGCPVIASIAGARLVLLVTEPTRSGLHDLRRVADLCRQFRVGAAVCVNKADLNLEVAAEIEAEAAARGLPVLGRIRYDEAVTMAQVRRRAVVEDGASPAAADIRALWARVQRELAKDLTRP